MARHVMVVLTNAVEGRDEEFNRWYDEEHLQHVLTLPGAVSAQRFVLGDVQRHASPHPYRYMALYEFETDDIAATVADLRARGGGPTMPLSDTMAEQRLAGIFQPLGPPQTPRK